VPVLPVQPGNGGSTEYQIIEFRPWFITDQTGSAMKGDPPSATNGLITDQTGSAMKGDPPSATNGLITDSTGVVSLEVVFININALPPPPTENGTTPWQGGGAKILQLVN
jgi:hypothetical protein